MTTKNGPYPHLAKCTFCNVTRDVDNELICESCCHALKEGFKAQYQGEPGDDFIAFAWFKSGALWTANHVRKFPKGWS